MDKANKTPETLEFSLFKQSILICLFISVFKQSILICLFISCRRDNYNIIKYIYTRATCKRKNSYRLLI